MKHFYFFTLKTHRYLVFRPSENGLSYLLLCHLLSIAKDSMADYFEKKIVNAFYTYCLVQK